MGSKLQVVFISPHSDPEAILGEPDAGGQCLYEYQLATALTQIAPVTVTALCRQTGIRPEVSQISPDFQIRRISCGPEGFIPKENIEAVLPEFTQRSLEWLKTLPPGPIIFHGHYWDAAKVVLYLKKLLPELHFIWTPHSLGVPKRNTFKAAKRELQFNFVPRIAWENYAILAADKVVTTSQVTRQLLENEYEVNNNIEVVTPGTDMTMFTPVTKARARKELGFPQDKVLLLCLGRMVYYKGYQHAILALKQLHRRMHEKAYLVICGGSKGFTGEEEIVYQKELHALIKKTGLTDYVMIRPAIPHESINKIYSAADLFLMTSENEPFGITVVEAMASRVPVVSNNKGGPLDIIRHNQTGCLVDMNNPVRVAYYLESLIKDEIYRERIIENAFAYVNSNFSWEEKAREFMDIYRASLSQSQKGNVFNKLMRRNYFLNRNLSL